MPQAVNKIVFFNKKNSCRVKRVLNQIKDLIGLHDGTEGMQL